MRLCLHKGKGLISSLIKFQTRSPFTHASLLFSDGLVIESREFIGVHSLGHLKPRKGEVIEVFEVPCSPKQEHMMRIFAMKQLGKPYDYVSILRFLTREPVHRWQQDDWFCSELAFQTFEIAEIHLLQNIKAWAVNPGHLSLSPVPRLKHILRG